VRLLASALVTAVLGLGSLAYPVTQSDPMNPPLRAFLEKEMGLSAMEMQSVIDGRPVAKLLGTRTEDEVALFGVVRIHAPQDLFITRFRDITAFESGKGVLGIGRFHSPPTLSDVTALQIDQKDLKEIPRCQPGDCMLKLSDSAMQSLRQQVDWTSPQAANQAQTLIRRAFVDYVANYQKIGDAALAVNNDRDKPQAIREDFRRLLQHSSHLFQYEPQLANYLEAYPQARPPGTEDIFYWQNAEFGLKPVVRASHLVIQRRHQGSEVTYAIASKMLFASHYFRAALELKSLARDNAAPGEKSFYLICLNRSFVDGLTGVKGGLIRGTVKSRSRDSLTRYLASVKQKIEAARWGQ
jgi:plasmid stabilization system protein ParE